MEPLDDSSQVKEIQYGRAPKEGAPGEFETDIFWVAAYGDDGHPLLKLPPSNLAGIAYAFGGIGDRVAALIEEDCGQGMGKDYPINWRRLLRAQFMPGEPADLSVFVATLDTRNFTFLAAGPSRESALKAMTDGLAGHAVDAQIEPDWFAEYLEDIRLHEVPAGRCLRDGEPVRTAPERDDASSLDRRSPRSRA